MSLLYEGDVCLQMKLWWSIENLAPLCKICQREHDEDVLSVLFLFSALPAAPNPPSKPTRDLQRPKIAALRESTGLVVARKKASSSQPQPAAASAPDPYEPPDIEACCGTPLASDRSEW